MVSRLVRYWLEIVPGTRTGPRNARVPRTVAGRCPSLVEWICAPSAVSASTRSLLGRFCIEMCPSITVGSGRSAAKASIRRAVTALCPTSSSTRPAPKLPPRPGDAHFAFARIVHLQAEAPQAIFHAPVVVSLAWKTNDTGAVGERSEAAVAQG